MRNPRDLTNQQEIDRLIESKENASRSEINEINRQIRAMEEIPDFATQYE